ncbi:hypothetical protein DPX16_6247 [Anabarilius grahami]|uniref:Uncharacterized protein n=1 Tax=Anabarilius grahami TaxID=495550 RepID=A0A3N0XCY4_ANAGA|nr:hypothetical protein DPX16_6247 [Anabarilius grahami]
MHLFAGLRAEAFAAWNELSAVEEAQQRIVLRPPTKDSAGALADSRFVRRSRATASRRLSARLLLPSGASKSAISCGFLQLSKRAVPAVLTALKEPLKRRFHGGSVATMPRHSWHMPCRPSCVGCLGKSHVEAALTRTSCSHCESISLATLHSQIAFFTESVEELDLEWAPPEEPSQSRFDKRFLPGRRQAPRQRSAPFFPEVHDELTKSWRAPYSARIRTMHYSALTTVDGSEEKGYEHLPPLDVAVAAHLCPPAAVGWKTKRALPSKPCRTTSALAGRAYVSMAILQRHRLCTACHEGHSLGHWTIHGQPGRAQAPFVAQPDRDKVVGQDGLPGHPGLSFRSLRASGRGLHGTLHRSTEVVPSHATLPAQALQFCFCFQPPQVCAGSAEQACPLYLSGSATQGTAPAFTPRKALLLPETSGTPTEDFAGSDASKDFLICQEGRGWGKVSPRPDHPKSSFVQSLLRPV